MTKWKNLSINFQTGTHASLPESKSKRNPYKVKTRDQKLWDLVGAKQPEKLSNLYWLEVCEKTKQLTKKETL